MTRAVIAGPGADALIAALEAEDVVVTPTGTSGNRPALEEAGIVDADVLVLTDTALATSIPVAKDLNDDLRIVVYASDSLPEFAKGQADILLDPELFTPESVAEELATGS
jgi:Trk K+ transport system NAD-binding subunit